MDAAGKIAAEFTIEHSAEGIAALIRRLARYGDPAGMPVGIERPNGRLAGLLLEAGYPVVPVSPNAIKTWREGEVLSGAKSDAGDAAVIAEYLRLRRHRLKTAAPYSDETLALRTVVHSRGDLVEMRVAATNQLSALLDAHWPGAKAVFADVESPISLEFLTRYPTPAAAAHLGEKRMAAFCVKHGYSGRRTVANTTFADNSRHASPWAAKIYADARASGKDHPHATRILARAWIRVIWPCWLHGIPYDPARHGAAAALTNQTAQPIAA